LKKLLGEKAIVSIEISIQEELDDLMFLSDQMSVIFTAVIALLALALLARSTTTAIQGFIGGSLGVLLTWQAAQGLTTLKFSLPNGLQKSDDPAAFLGSQYVAPVVEANLPLSLDPLLWLNTPIAIALI
jgi:hypothetical protein